MYFRRVFPTEGFRVRDVLVKINHKIVPIFSTTELSQANERQQLSSLKRDTSFKRHYSRQLSKHFRLFVVLRPCNRASYSGNTTHKKVPTAAFFRTLMSSSKSENWGSHGVIHITVFWHVTPSCLPVSCLFARPYCLHLQARRVSQATKEARLLRPWRWTQQTMFFRNVRR